MAEVIDHQQNDEVATRLVDSARTLLLEQGLDQVTVRSVAVGAGLSTMNVYSRFGGKDGLLDALYREGFETLRATLQAVDEPSVQEHLRAAARAYRRFAFEHPARYELMFGGEGRGFRPSEASAELARSVLAGAAKRIADAEAAGEIELPPGSDPVQAAAAMWAMVHGTLAFERGSVADSLLDWSLVAGGGVDALIERYCRTPVL
jgi:AcrR family transcriptional regulator